MWLNPSPTTVDIQAGDTVELSGHQVYNSTLATLQATVEARYRAAGTRVRVIPARAVFVSLNANIVGDESVKTSGDLTDLIARTKLAIVEYFTSIPPGEPLYMHALHDALGTVEGLKNIVFTQGDKYPGSPFHRLTTLAGLISIT